MVECVVLVAVVVVLAVVVELLVGRCRGVLAVVVELLVGRCSELTCVSGTKKKKTSKIQNKLEAGQAWAGVLVKNGLFFSGTLH